MDSDIKDKAQKVAQQLGIPLGSIINGYLREFLRTKEVSFSCATNKNSIAEIGDSKKETFRGTIIQESLENLNVLKNCTILSTEISKVTERHKTPWVSQWTKHKVEVCGLKNARDLAKQISRSIDSKHEHAWYADYNDGKTVFIIFPNKIFEFDGQNGKELASAREYGISIGIPEYQVDFKKIKAL